MQQICGFVGPACGRARGVGDAGFGQALRASSLCRVAVGVEAVQILRGVGRQDLRHDGAGGREHGHDYAPRTHRSGGADHSVEFPHRHVHLEGGAGVGGWQLCGVEDGGADSAFRHPSREAGSGSRHSPRCAQHRLRVWPHRRWRLGRAHGR